MNKNWACGKPRLLLISPEQALGQIVNDNGNTIIMAAPTICSGPPTSGVNTFYYLLRPSPLPREAGHPHAADTRAPTRVCAQAGENLWPRFTGQEPEALKKGGHLPETKRPPGLWAAVADSNSGLHFLQRPFQPSIVGPQTSWVSVSLSPLRFAGHSQDYPAGCDGPVGQPLSSLGAPIPS